MPKDAKSYALLDSNVVDAEAVELSETVPDAPLATPLPSNPGDWPCKRCTLINPGSISTCSACRCPKPGSNVQTSAPPTSQTGPKFSAAPYNAGHSGSDGAPSYQPSAGHAGRSGGRGNGGYVLPFAEAERRSPAPSSGPSGSTPQQNRSDPQRQQQPVGSSSMFGSMFGPSRQQMEDGPADEEELKKEQCAQMGCMCSVCCPAAGCVTYMMNQDAAPNSRRRKLAKTAVLIALVMMMLQLMFFFMR
mmetsp:Transcript_13321/g.19060  ORF Transcript_13321/g.19060 Transcript_13321/m.19060 type:complete len:247 (+) Transcript_13321:48-788(+)